MVIHQIFPGFVLLFGISGGEILILLLVVLVLFGPSKIPEIARMLGRGINEVKKVQREINTEIHRYSSEIEKETSRMQSEIDDIKKQVAKSADEPGDAGSGATGADSGEVEPHAEQASDKEENAAAEKRRREPRPDPYEEALANDPRKPNDAGTTGQQPADEAGGRGKDAPEAGKEEPPAQGGIGEAGENMENPDMAGDDDQKDPFDDDLPYPYNKNKRDAVD